MTKAAHRFPLKSNKSAVGLLAHEPRPNISVFAKTRRIVEKRGRGRATTPVRTKSCTDAFVLGKDLWGLPIFLSPYDGDHWRKTASLCANPFGGFQMQWLAGPFLTPARGAIL